MKSRTHLRPAGSNGIQVYAWPLCALRQKFGAVNLGKKERFRAVKQVAAAIALKGSKVLVTRRALGQSLEGHWEFPGGKLEGDESVQDCIVRELEEELSVRVRAGEIMTQSVYEYAGGAINLIVVYVELIEGDMQLSVHDALDWVHPKELHALNLAPADIPIAEELIKRHG